MDVPLRDPRSVTRTVVPTSSSAACRRETVRSVTTMSHEGLLPMSRREGWEPSSENVFPASGPSTTTSRNGFGIGEGSKLRCSSVV